MKRLSIAILSAAVLSACTSPASEPAPAAPSEAEAPVVVGDVAVERAEESCDVLEARDWEAWVNRMPGPGAEPTLHVVGKVDVRTGGYTFDWQEGPLDRSAMPALRLQLIPVKPDGMATQAITTEDVKFEKVLGGITYSRVLISCGGEPLGEIAEITDAY